MNKNKVRFLVIAMAVLIVLSGISSVFIFGTVTTDFSITKIRVACVGDSITQGTWYPFDLAMLLGPNYQVRNFGDSGSSVCLESSNPYMNSSQF